MISFDIKKDDFIKQITVKGHAAQNDFGKDIVCASVSTAIILSVNLLEKFSKLDCVKYVVDEGIFDITVSNKDEVINNILENLEYSLNDLKIQYPKYIKWK